MGQIIAVVSGKGGTGKTSFTALVGAALAALGYRTLCLDCDIALRNLDLALGLSDRALMDFSDVIAHRAALDEAVVRHPKYDSLYFLAAPVSMDAERIPEEQMRDLLTQIRAEFDYCLIDAAAGLGASFRLSTCAADRVIVISGTDPTSLRDAQRTVMELRRFPIGKVHLVVNRVKRRLLKKIHANLDDAIDAAGLPLLGVIPEDEAIPIALGRTSLTAILHRSPALEAARNIAGRITGRRIPLMKLPKR